MKKKKVITSDVFPARSPIWITLLFTLYALHFEASPMAWFFLGVFFLVIWCATIISWTKQEEVNPLPSIQILERKVELLWADMPDEKRRHLKKQIDTVLRAEGLIEKESFEERLNKALKDKDQG
jgi:hypothetical protein